MIAGLGGATIWSEDVGNLLPFYRDVIGLRVGQETPDVVVFGDGTQPALHGRTVEPARHMVGLVTNDIQADAARLKAGGVRFLEEPNDPGGGFWLATIEDPDGNLIQLFQFERGT